MWRVGDIHRMGLGRGGWEGGGRGEEKRETGSTEEEQDNKVQDIQDKDKQQRCIVSIQISTNSLYPCSKRRAKT